jgi:hypothetical protein
VNNIFLTITLMSWIRKIKLFRGWGQWYTPAMPATQEPEIRRIVVQGQPR